MFICEHIQNNAISILKLKNKFGFRKSGHPFVRALEEVNKHKNTAVLIDVSGVGNLSYAGIGVLIDAIVQFQSVQSYARPVALVGMAEKTQKRLEKAGLDKVLHLFPTLDAALQTPAFKGRQLQGHRMVLLCAESCSALDAISIKTPSPMLDLLGKPILERAMERASAFGVNDFIINPFQNGEKIIGHFHGKSQHNIFYLHEDVRWQRKGTELPITPVNTLSRLHYAHSIFETDTIIMAGSALNTIDLAKMMTAHRLSDADVSVSRTNQACQTDGQVIIMRPGIFDIFPKEMSLDAEIGLVAFMQRAGVRVEMVDTNHNGFEVKCGDGYFSALETTLNAPNFGVTPAGVEIEENLWVDLNAKIGRKLQITGPCYIGSKAEVQSDINLAGTCVIGAGAIIESKSSLSNSVLTPNTYINRGTVYEKMIVGPNGSISHSAETDLLQLGSAATTFTAADQQSSTRKDLIQ